MPRKDYVPDSFRNLRDWTDNYLRHLAPIAARVGWPPVQISELEGRLSRLRSSTQTILDRLSELDQAIAGLDNTRKVELPEIRRETSFLKAAHGFTNADAATLQVMSPAHAIDPATFKPLIHVESKIGRLEIHGKKLGVDSFNIYRRLPGETEWQLLAARRVRLPVEDDTLPLPPKTYEEREYRAVGVLHEREIGLPSDPVSGVFVAG